LAVGERLLLLPFSLYEEEGFSPLLNGHFNRLFLLVKKSLFSCKQGTFLFSLVSFFRPFSLGNPGIKMFFSGGFSSSAAVFPWSLVLGRFLRTRMLYPVFWSWLLKKGICVP